MKITDFISLQAGGPGSGCNPMKGRCGRFKTSEKKLLKEKGFLINLKKKGIPIKGTPENSRNVLKKVHITQKIGIPIPYGPPMKYVNYTYTSLRGTDSKVTPGFNATPFSSEPPDKPHPFKGKFHEVLRVPPDDMEKGTRIVFDAGKDDMGVQGATMFVRHYRTGPNTANVSLEEFDREGNEIIGKREINFNTAKSARDFLSYRHGIKIVWGKK